MDEDEIRKIINDSVTLAFNKMPAELEQVAYRVGRTLQGESYTQFLMVFQHVFNINPSNPTEVKELQKTLNHAEDLRKTHLEDKANLRRGIVAAVLGWMGSIVAIIWALFHGGK